MYMTLYLARAFFVNKFQCICLYFYLAIYFNLSLHTNGGLGKAMEVWGRKSPSRIQGWSPDRPIEARCMYEQCAVVKIFVYTVQY